MRQYDAETLRDFKIKTYYIRPFLIVVFRIVPRQLDILYALSRVDLEALSVYRVKISLVNSFLSSEYNVWIQMNYQKAIESSIINSIPLQKFNFGQG